MAVRMSTATPKAPAERRRLAVRPTPTYLAVLAVLAVLVVVVAPIVTVILASLWSAPFPLLPGDWSLKLYEEVLTNSGSIALLGNTLALTFGASLLALVVGTFLAWAVARTDIPFAGVVKWLPLCPLLLTALLKDTGWIELYSPSTGLVNLWLRDTFGLSRSPFNIYSMWGMIASMGFNLAPIIYFILLGPLSTMSRHTDEASRTSGAGPARTFFRVTLPQLRPALISGFALTAVLAASTFETPVIIGLPAGINTYMSEIYTSIRSGGTPNYDLAAAQSVLYLVFTAVLMIWYLRTTRMEKKFVLLSGRGHDRGVTRLGKWRWLVFATILLILVLSFLQLVVITIMVSLVPFYTATNGNPFRTLTFSNYSSVFSTPGTRSAIADSFIVGALVAVVTLAVALLLAVVSFKTRIRGRRLAEVIGTMPIAIPPLVFSVALLLTVLTVPGVDRLYNTSYLLIIAEVVVFLPYGLRVISSTLVSIGDELLEASRASGAAMARTLRSIVVPVLAPALINAGAIVFVMSLRELGSVVLLVPPNMNLMPTQIFTIWGTGDFGAVSAFNVISVLSIMLVLGTGALIYRAMAHGISRFQIGRRT
jgi:iron(III) transport system permease protein